MQAWIEIFLAVASQAYLRPLPWHMIEEFERYLRLTETRAPTQSEIAELPRRVHVRVLPELERCGMPRDSNDATNETEDEPMLECAQMSL